MADDLIDRGTRDRNRIDVNEDWQVRYWATQFACTATELCDAVKAAGTPMADKVEAYLEKQKA